MRNGDWMSTYTGRQFWPCDPRPEEIEILDIAHALSNLCRFTGHCRWFYSVAQHSVLVSEIVAPEYARWGLLHDASEAYLTDVSRPVKPHLSNYKTLESRLMAAICERFGLPEEMPEAVHVADDILVCTERRDLMHPGPDWGEWSHGIPLMENRIVPWTNANARHQFLNRYFELFSRSPNEHIAKAKDRALA